jgi:hypothetical protein
MRSGTKSSAALQRLTRVSLLIGALGGIACFLPSAALACPNCFSSTNEGVLKTYYLTAALLTLLPLVMIGGFVTWLYRRSKQAELQSEQTPVSSS